MREKLQITERLMSQTRKDEIKEITYNNYKFHKNYFRSFELEKKKKDDLLSKLENNWNSIKNGI